MRASFGVLSRAPSLGVHGQRGNVPPADPPDPHVPDFNSAYARRSLAQARLFLRPVLFIADGTIAAGDRMLLARRYGREN